MIANINYLKIIFLELIYVFRFWLNNDLLFIGFLLTVTNLSSGNKLS